MRWRSLFFLLMVMVSGSSTFKEVPSERIHLNQIGFYPESPKVAVIKGNTPQDFLVKEVLSGKVVFRGKLKEVRKNQFSGKLTRIAEFAELKIPGHYRLALADGSVSSVFKIEKKVHRGLAIGALKGFYYQRASTPLLPVHAGKWARNAGHQDDKVLIHGSAISTNRPKDALISSSRGWYDAGDYNEYIVNSGITMATLMSLLEDYPEFCKGLSTNIPESTNQLPDLLDEVLWNLRWMLTMQDPSDGGVYHKLTNASFDPTIMPERATRARYVVQKGTAATLDFAAVMAQSVRVVQQYKKQLPGLADSCKTAAIKAWGWAKKNPAVYYRQSEINKKFSPAITTGEYGDQNIEDEWIWAATELHILTGNPAYLPKIQIDKSVSMPIPTWNQVKPLAYYSLVKSSKTVESNATQKAQLAKEDILLCADNLLNEIEKQPYQVVMGKDPADFRWGSSSVAANQGIVLLHAYRLSHNRKYLEAALGNLDYLLGRNATGYCFVTGFGSKSVMHPHHRVSMADGVKEPVPGLLSGGPNAGKQDKCASYTSNYPDESFTDDDCSYASNEIAINWNAPLVYLVVALEAEFGKLVDK